MLYVFVISSYISSSLVFTCFFKPIGNPSIVIHSVNSLLLVKSFRYFLMMLWLSLVRSVNGDFLLVDARVLLFAGLICSPISFASHSISWQKNGQYS